jgi:hypothetical protein
MKRNRWNSVPVVVVAVADLVTEVAVAVGIGAIAGNRRLLIETPKELSGPGLP